MIFEIWVGCFYHASNAMNFVTTANYSTVGVVEYRVFVKDLVDCSATTDRIIFTEYVIQIAKQQRRYAVGHRVLRFRVAGREPTDVWLIL